LGKLAIGETIWRLERDRRNGKRSEAKVSLQSHNAVHTTLYGKACGAFSLAGGAEGFLSTSISPEGSVTVDEVSTINASGVLGPEKNGAVYI
jgi:hypothetical protein